MEDLKDWKYIDFKAYILIHAANADFNIQQEELDLLLKKLGHAEVEKVQKAYKNHKDLEKSELIYNLSHKFCPELKQKEMLMEEIVEVLRSDNVFSSTEKAFVTAVRKLI